MGRSSRSNRVKAMSEAVRHRSVPESTGYEGDADVHPWATPAAYAIDAAIVLLGPLGAHPASAAAGSSLAVDGGSKPSRACQ